MATFFGAGSRSSSYSAKSITPSSPSAAPTDPLPTGQTKPSDILVNRLHEIKRITKSLASYLDGRSWLERPAIVCGVTAEGEARIVWVGSESRVVSGGMGGVWCRVGGCQVDKLGYYHEQEAGYPSVLGCEALSPVCRRLARSPSTGQQVNHNYTLARTTTTTLDR